MDGVKHLIQCHCVLPQYRRRTNPIFHRFVVFSVIDDEDQVIPKLVSCNNCGAVHRVTEINRSEIVPHKEGTRSIITEAELAMTLPTDLVDLFRSYKVDKATWEEAVWIIDESQWGKTVTLIRESDGEEVNGKVLTYVSPGRFRVESFTRKESGE